MFTADRVTKRYADVTALDGVALSAEKGEILGLVGPNGAGKTTLLKSAVGLVRPDAGDITAAGIDVRRDPVAARGRIGYMPGDCGLYDRWSGRALLDFCLGAYPRADVDSALADSLVARFELPLAKRVRGYSTGMRRKLLLIQALAVRVPLLVLDEPTEGLDPTTRAFLADHLRRRAEAGTTVLFSSHQLDEVEEISHRIAFLHHGRLLDIDTVAAIRARASHYLRVTLPEDADPALLEGPTVASVTAADGEWLVEAAGDPAATLRALAGLPVTSLEFNRARVSELYRDLYGVDGTGDAR